MPLEFTLPSLRVRCRLLVGVGCVGVSALLVGCDEFEDIAEAEGPAPLSSVPAPPRQAKSTPRQPSKPSGTERRRLRPGEYVDQQPEHREGGSDESVDQGMARSPLLPEQEEPSPGGAPPGARVYPQNVSNRPIPRVTAQPWIIDEPWMQRHQWQTRAPGRDDAEVVFLGDSIIAGWRMAPAYSRSFSKYSPLNLGIASDHTQHVLYRVDHGALEGLKAKAVVILVGVNNLAGGFTPEQTVDGIRAVVGATQNVLPDVSVVLLAVLPARANPEDPLRKKIVETNRQLASFAQGSNVVFHDAGSVLLEPDGTIERSTLRDFLHPSMDGYARLSESLAPVLEKVVGK